MKPKISFFAFANHNTIDQNNRHSLIGIFQKYTTDKLPAKIAPFLTFYRVLNVKGAKKVEVRISDESGELVDSAVYGGDNQDLNIPDDKANISTTFTDITLRKKGKYFASIYIDGQELSSTPEPFFELTVTDAK